MKMEKGRANFLLNFPLILLTWSVRGLEGPLKRGGIRYFIRLKKKKK